MSTLASNLDQDANTTDSSTLALLESETHQTIQNLAQQWLGDSEHITIDIPASLYTELQQQAQDSQCTPLDIVAYAIAKERYQRLSWTEKWQALCDTVQQDGGLDVPNDEETFFAHMRKIREEVYEEEYAHLYDHLYR